MGGVVPASAPAGPYHHLLARLAGQVPDDLLLRARRLLVDGRTVDVARIIDFAVFAGRLRIPPEDLNLLAETIRSAGGESAAHGAATAGPASPPPHAFVVSPAHPTALPPWPQPVPYGSDLTAADPSGLDDVDRAVGVAAAAAEALGVWRAWRVPAVATPWPPPRRLYLAQADPATDAVLPTVQVRLQEALAEVEDPVPVVDVFADPETLPTYHRAVLAVGALVWAAVPARPVHVVEATRVDRGDAERLGGTAREVVVGYLRDGSPLIRSDELTTDRCDPARGAVVPTGYRTDGEWVWSEAVEYYLSEHGVVPERGLLRRVDDLDGIVPEVDAVTTHRALCRLRQHLQEA
ncbi:hypothetical protein [Micromonospora sp. NPDC093277]|uniref:hypothetical protein n=1 Tax=Micromonospora sp. NPDC093277 TaxID=3364291 RepID=UPI0038049C33